jgi:hypothetical protein
MPAIIPDGRMTFSRATNPHTFHANRNTAADAAYLLLSE